LRSNREPPALTESIYPEVNERADRGRGAVVGGVTEKGELIVSVAVPVQRFRAVLVFCCFDQAGEHRQDRSWGPGNGHFRCLGVCRHGQHRFVAAALPSTIATPLRRLSAAARPGPPRRPGTPRNPGFF